MQDFEVFFYSGAKVTKSGSENEPKVCDQHGRQLNNLQEYVAQALLAHYEECLRHCQSICNALEFVQVNGNCSFPVVIGRRPTTDIQVQREVGVGSLRDNMNCAYSTPKSQQVRQAS